MENRPTFLLVHGSWHGAWCWEPLRAALDRRGYRTAAVDLPSCGTDPAALGGLAEDAATVAAAAAAIAGDVVAVGHSYGGVPISEARFGANVRRLIFLAAFMPDTGRSYVSYLPPGPLPPYVGLRGDGTMAVPAEEARGAFYADCTPEVAAWAEARLRLQSQSVMGPPITRASWRDIPAGYIVATADRALPPDFQRMFAAQAADIREIASSHSPMLSQPDALAATLIAMADGRQMRQAG